MNMICFGAMLKKCFAGVPKDVQSLMGEVAGLRFVSCFVSSFPPQSEFSHDTSVFSSKTEGRLRSVASFRVQNGTVTTSGKVSESRPQVAPGQEPGAATTRRDETKLQEPTLTVDPIGIGWFFLLILRGIGSSSGLATGHLDLVKGSVY